MYKKKNNNFFIPIFPKNFKFFLYSLNLSYTSEMQTTSFSIYCLNILKEKIHSLHLKILEKDLTINLKKRYKRIQKSFFIFDLLFIFT